MPHHEMKKEGEMKKGQMGTSESTSDYEAKMKERGQEIQQGRIREKEAGAHMLETGQGGPEAGEMSNEGFGMAGSKGTETIKRSKEQNR